METRVTSVSDDFLEGEIVSILRNELFKAEILKSSYDGCFCINTYSKNKSLVSSELFTGKLLQAKHRATNLIALYKENIMLKPFKEMELELSKDNVIHLPVSYICTANLYNKGKQRVTTKSGVYFFIDYSRYNNEGEIVYIGRAKNLQRRIREHFGGKGVSAFATKAKKESSKLDVIAIIEEKEYLIDMYETYFIQKHNPRYNLQKTNKSYNLGGGRPKRKLSDKYLKAIELMQTHSIAETAVITDISTATLKRIRKQYKEEVESGKRKAEFNI